MLDTECSHLVAPKSLLFSQESGISTACSVEWTQMSAAVATGHGALIRCNDLICTQPSLSGEMADGMVYLQLHKC